MSLLLLLGASSPPKLYWVVQAAAVADPSGAQVVAGLDGSGAAAVDAGEEDAPTITTAPFTFTTPATGLSPGTNYEIAFVWYDGTNYSNVAVGSFTTTSAAVSPPPYRAPRLAALLRF
jgi:hypothetical protein